MTLLAPRCPRRGHGGGGSGRRDCRSEAIDESHRPLSAGADTGEERPPAGEKVLYTAATLSDEQSAVEWMRQQLLRKSRSFQELQPRFIDRTRAGQQKQEKPLELAELLEPEDHRDTRQRRIEVFRLEAVRSGFEKAWQERDQP